MRDHVGPDALAGRVTLPDFQAATPPADPGQAARQAALRAVAFLEENHLQGNAGYVLAAAHPGPLPRADALRVTDLYALARAVLGDAAPLPVVRVMPVGASAPGVALAYCERAVYRLVAAPCGLEVWPVDLGEGQDPVPQMLGTAPDLEAAKALIRREHPLPGA